VTTPTFDFTVEEGGEELTGFDLEAIRRAFGRDFTELGSTALTALTWALLGHDPATKVDVATVKAMSMKTLAAMYVPATDPEVDEGKAGRPGS
jgi:hypothetical protein